MWAMQFSCNITVPFAEGTLRTYDSITDCTVVVCSLHRYSNCCCNSFWVDGFYCCTCAVYVYVVVCSVCSVCVQYILAASTYDLEMLLHQMTINRCTDSPYTRLHRIIASVRREHERAKISWNAAHNKTRTLNSLHCKRFRTHEIIN